MSYSLAIYRGASKTLAKIPSPDYERIRDAIRELANNPRPFGCKKLIGRPAWRIRVGNYRAIYEINDKKQIITVVDVGHRKDVY